MKNFYLNAACREHPNTTLILAKGRAAGLISRVLAKLYHRRCFVGHTWDSLGLRCSAGAHSQPCAVLLPCKQEPDCSSSGKIHPGRRDDATQAPQFFPY